MDIIFVLTVAIFIEKSCSQILQPSTTCLGNGDEIKLVCTTVDFNQVINFVLNNNIEAGCAPSCAVNIIQAGTTTTYTLSFSSSTHSGNWTCSYGSSMSPIVVIAENPCTTIITTPTTTTTTTSTSKAPTTASISTTKIKTTNAPTTTSTSSSTVTPTSSPTHSTTPNTCRIFFKEKPCALNYLTLAEIVVFVIASFCVVGYFIIRNRKHQ
ncbi:integumentary mucin C.1-like [Mytilus trossulus]|uniref:integumentary mucin C.1-like n=1 Tax=Mytilus trossulus TaxID=6551 RepID=UPI003006ECD1